MPGWILRQRSFLEAGGAQYAGRWRWNRVRSPCSETASATSHDLGNSGPDTVSDRSKPEFASQVKHRAPSLPPPSGGGDTVSRDGNGLRMSFRRPTGVLARRAAGAFLLAAFALCAAASKAEAQTPPDAPTGVGVTAGSGNGFTLSWTAPSGTVDSYTWEHRSPAGTSRAWTEGGSGVTGTSVTSTIAGLVTTATEFRVRGVNSVGDGLPSGIVVLAAKPGKVTGLDADRGNVPGVPDGTVRLRWVAPVVDGIDNGRDDITGYDYERAVANSNSFGNAGSTTGTQVDIGGLDDNTSYDFRVRARNADRVGEWTVLTVPGRPQAGIAGTNPSPLTEAALRAGTATLTVELAGGAAFVAADKLEDTFAPWFNPPSGSIEIRAFERLSGTRVRLTLALVSGTDIVADGNLAIRVAGSAYGGGPLLTTGSVRVLATRTLTLLVDPNPLAEGATASVTAKMVPAPPTQVTLAVSIAQSSGSNPIENDDLEQGGWRLTIAAGATTSTGTVTLHAFQDDDEDDEEVTVRVEVREGLATPDAVVTLTIIDDDGTAIGTGVGDGGLPPANTPATGGPSISGTAAVGQTLTAGQGTINDADGLANASITWQWVRVGNGGAERDIAGAIGPTYRITDADLGRTLKVRASFTDNAGNAERRTSAATATVVGEARTARVTAAVERTLAAVTRRAVTSALDNIGARLADTAPASDLTLAGETVSLGPAAGAARAGFTPLCPQEALGRHGAGTAFDATGFAAPEGCVAAARTRGIASEELLGASAFSLTLGAVEGSRGFDPKAPRWSLWGRGDLGSFKGHPEPGTHYDGDLTTGWLGVDARAGAWVAGVAVSHGTGEAAYAFEGSAGAGQGRLETSLTAVYPYGRWTVAEGLELHGVLGAGQGEARHGLDDGPDTTSDLSMRMASIGLRHELPALAGIDLAARADVHVARLETDDGPDYIHGLTADSWRARAGLEASRHIVLDGNAALTPFVEAAARRDGGDGLEGTGLEVAGGLRYTAPRLELEARGRWLAAHSEDGAEEQGVSLTARVGPGANGRGLSLALNPRWGAATGGDGALWREELPTTAGTPAGAALDARVGYGVVLPPYGVLTPFALTGLEDADRQRVGIGVRFAAPHLHFDVEVAGDHREGGAAGPEQVLGVDLGLRF